MALSPLLSAQTAFASRSPSHRALTGLVLIDEHPRSIGGTHNLLAAAKWPIHTANTDLNTGAVSSIWPGIGTGNSTADSLVQEGARQDVLCGRSTCTRTYYMWYEIDPQQSEQRVSDFPVAANDVVGAEAGYDPPRHQSAFRLYNLQKETPWS